MEHDTLKSIHNELQRANRLIAFLLIKDEEKQNDKILKLNLAGFQPKEIADIIGTTPNTVSVALSDIKKKKIKKK